MIKRTIGILFISIVMLCGCSSNRCLSDCDEIIKSDSTHYFVSGIIDHTELQRDWIKEEINKDDIRDWVRKYISNEISQIIYTDSTEIQIIRNQVIENIYQEWQQVESKLLNVDRVFYYSTPEEYWAALSGQDGLIVLRDCKILYVLILSQS